jgi:ParB-like chromosome segregation protein Spo0J
MNIRNRVKSLRMVPASDLRPNPKNWRTHPKAQQDALRGVLAEVGLADACLARELPDGSLMLIDGHLRAETLGDGDVPVLILDVNEAEADKLLATLDPLAAMAEADGAKFEELIRTFNSSNVALQELVAHIAQDSTEQALRELAKQEMIDGDDEDNDSSEMPEGHVSFSVPLTTAQEVVIRKVLRIAKSRFGCESSGEALANALQEWADGTDK